MTAEGVLARVEGDMDEARRTLGPSLSSTVSMLTGACTLAEADLDGAMAGSCPDGIGTRSGHRAGQPERSSGELTRVTRPR